MKNEGAIKYKLKQVRTRHLHKLLDVSLRKRPHNCIFNERRVSQDGAEIHICLKDLTICDVRFEGVDKAKGCPIFSPIKDKTALKDDFREFVETASRAEIAFRYPDMAPLMWVLDNEDEEVVRSDDPFLDEPDVVEEPACISVVYTVPARWWSFLFKWFRK